MGIANKALNLAYFEWLGDANQCNLQTQHYNAVTTTQISETAKVIFRPDNCSILRYLSNH
jgi:hypothetical protein